MAKGVTRDWPTDDALCGEIAPRHLSVESAGRELGMTGNVLDRHLRRQGIKTRFRAALGREDVQPIAGEVSEVEILRVQNAELRHAVQRVRKGDVFAERIVQAAELAAGKVAVAPPFRPVKRTKVGEGAHHRGLLVLSDFHGGEVVDPEVVNGLNAYSWDIMRDRIGELLVGLESHVRNGSPLTGLDIGFLGDMCSGSNHDELAITNEFPLAEQAVKMGGLQAQIAREAQYRLGVPVTCFGVEGNHPRFAKPAAAKNPHDNGDWIASVFAREALVADDIAFQVGRGSIMWEIAGRTIYVFHGDGIRSSMPGVPWGGITRRVNVLQSQYVRRIHHYLLGHFHQANIVQGGRILGNGSLKGVDEWCLKQFGGGDPPTQLLLTFDERNEWLTNVGYLTPTAGIPA